MPPAHLNVTSGSECESESLNKLNKNNIPLTKLIPRARSFVCNFGDCKETFTRADQFDRHYFRHDGVKKHICLHDNCLKSYTILTHLKRHLKTFHEKEKINITKDFECNFCNKKFDYDYKLQRHKRDIHDLRKTYTCQQCDLKFLRKIKLKRHEIENHGKDYPYKCDICNKGFIIQLQQRKHNCKTTYPCPVCKENFSKWSELTAHKVSTRHNKHTCTTCGKTFARPSLLKFHEENHNATNSQKVVFKCSYDGCAKTYYHRQNLNVHISRKHENKTFKCTFKDCDKELSTKQKLLLHIKTVHRDKDAESKCNKEHKKTNRSRRKDSGKPKISALSKLVGLNAPLNVEKELLNREDNKTIALEIVSTEDEDCENKQIPADISFEKMPI